MTPSGLAAASTWRRLVPGRRFVLLYASCGWLAGLWLGGTVAVPIWLVLPAAILPLAALPFLWRVDAARLALVALAAAFLGAARGAQARVVPADLPAGGAQVELQGVVDAEPDVRDRSVRLILRLERQRLAGSWVPARGKALVQTTVFQAADYGDRLLVRGALEAPAVVGTDGFDYRLWLARQGIGGVMRFPSVRVVETAQGNPLLAAITSARERVERVAGEILPEPQASLLRASLVGTKSATFADLTHDFVATGMIHLIATSGMKVNAVAGTVLLLFTPLVGRRRAVVVCLAGVALYVALTGATPAGVRAGLMWAAACSAVLAGRWGSSGQALALAAAVLAGIDPPALFDSGFQLSAVATAGLLVVGPALEPWLAALPRWAAEPVGATVAAQVTTLPILLVGFHQLSFISPLANLLCLPVLPWVMGLGALAVAADSVSHGLGVAAGWLVWVPLTWMIDVVHALAALPFASRPAAGQGAPFTLAYYALVVAAVALAPRPVATPPASQADGHAGGQPGADWIGPAVAACALALAVGAITAAGAPRDDLLHVTLLDVGKGDAALIRDPAGRAILVDAGSNPRVITTALGERLPPWHRRLDLLVLASYDQDELQGALEVADRYRPRAALAPAGKGTGALYEQWVARSAEAGIDVQPVLEPLAVALGDGARLEVRPVARAPTGAKGGPRVALRLVYGAFAVVFGGNLDPQEQQGLVDQAAPLRGTVLVVPRNGSPGSLSPAFAGAVAPAGVAIIADPAAKADSPSVDTLDQLAGLPVFRTDQLGSVELVSDGRSWGLRR